MEEQVDFEENPIESHHRHLVIDTLLAGALAGLVRDALLYPIEVYQFSRHLDVKLKLSRLVKGTIPAAIGAIPGAAAFITTYSLMKVHFSPYFAHERQYIVHMFSAFTAEVVALVFKVPVDNIKKRHMSLQNRVSTYGVIKRMRRSSGVGAFYRGFPPALFVRITSSLMSFPLWEASMEKVKKIKHGVDLTPAEISMCGALAGGIVGGITTPLHVARSYFVLLDIKELEKEMTEKLELKRQAKELRKLQPEEQLRKLQSEAQLKETPKLERPVIKVEVLKRKTIKSVKKFSGILAEIYVNKGFRGLYRGWLARVAQIALGGALFFFCYASVMEKLQDVVRTSAPCIQDDTCQGSGRVLAKVLIDSRSRTELPRGRPQGRVTDQSSPTPKGAEPEGEPTESKEITDDRKDVVRARTGPEKPREEDPIIGIKTTGMGPYDKSSTGQRPERLESQTTPRDIQTPAKIANDDKTDTSDDGVNRESIEQQIKSDKKSDNKKSAGLGAWVVGWLFWKKHKPSSDDEQTTSEEGLKEEPKEK